MTTLNPGIYKGTVCGEPDQIVMLTDGNTGTPWVTLNAQPGIRVRWFADKHVTDAHPLIVLDLTAEAARYVSDDLRNTRHMWTLDVADQIEAQTKPPRIEEPGLWGVVEAGIPDCLGVTEWTHRRDDRWHCPSHGYADWDVLIDPVLIREGIS